MRKLFSQLKALSAEKIISGVLIACVFIVIFFVSLWHVFAPLPFSTSQAYLDAVGPVQAQEVALHLSEEGSPAVDGHIYEHQVGAYIFQKYGVSGVGYCRTYFDHGCYNGFMLEMTSLDTVEAALADCSEINEDALGGCIHGAGHEALVLNDYNVPKALQLCGVFANTYAPSSTADALTACSFGVFMENAEPGMMESMANESLTGNMNMGMTEEASVSAPAHATWAPRSSDPSFPCDDEHLAPQYLDGCWRMQMVMLAGTLPVPKDIALCNNLTDASQKKYCFVGFADGYTTGPDMDTQKIFSACDYAVGVDWKDICLVDFVQRAYLNGYTDEMPEQVCSQIDSSGKAACDEMMQSMGDTSST